jgi:hypothetical protein
MTPQAMRRKAGEKRSPAQRAKDLEQIAALRLKAWTYQQIADEVRVSLVTVKREMKAIETAWRESASEDIAAVKARELTKLDDLEREARMQWERSCRKGRKTVTEEEPSATGKAKRRAMTVTRRRVEEQEQTGDPRYLAIVLDIQQRRARLLGLDMPTKIAPTNPDGTEGLDLRERDGGGWDLSLLSYDEVDALRQLQRKARAIPAPTPKPAAGNAGT